MEYAKITKTYQLFAFCSDFMLFLLFLYANGLTF